MRRLAWFAGGFGAACLWACYFPPGTRPMLIAALAAGLGLAGWLSTRPRAGEHPVLLRRGRDKGRYKLYQLSRRVLALGLGAASALLWASAYSALLRAPAEGLAGEEVFLSGEVASYPVETSIGGYSVTLRLGEGLLAPDALAFGPEDWGGLKPGDRVAFTGRVQPSARAFGDETTYYTAKGVYLIAYCRGEGTVTPAPAVPPRYWPALCAQVLKNGIYTAFDQTAAPIAAAVTLGDKSGLDETLYSAFNRAGLMHAAVVSGLHVSFLMGLALGLLGRSRRVALGLLPLLAFYALMAGGTASAFRAVIMHSALLFAPLARREGDGPTALAFALLLLLIQNPFATASVGLQLSFASVAGILLASEPLFRWLYRPLKARKPGKDRPVRGRLWAAGRYALTSASVSLGAMLFTAPLIALYFGQIPLLSPLSGILALWALSLLVPCALVLGTAAVFLPGPAALLGAPAGLLARYARWIALALGRFPFASLSTDSVYCLIWLGAAYLALAAAFLGRERPRRPLLGAGMTAVLLCAAIGLGRLEADGAELTAAALDVGQGSATVLQSGGRTALVDCGGSGSRSAGDIAADHFAAQGRTRLDLLVLTHFDSDHCNGVEQLFYRMRVDRVAVPAGDADPEAAARLMELAEAEGAQVVLVEGTERLSLGEAELTLFPLLGGGTSNESGLFVLCTAGEFDVLITGDADAFVEKMLVKYQPIPDIEVLVAGHHGSKHSSCGEFLQAAAPEIALISAGANNSYGHPAQETLERLEELGAEIHRTDREGTVTVRVKDGRVGIH